MQSKHFDFFLTSNLEFSAIFILLSEMSKWGRITNRRHAINSTNETNSHIARAGEEILCLTIQFLNFFHVKRESLKWIYFLFCKSKTENFWAILSIFELSSYLTQLMRMARISKVDAYFAAPFKREKHN